MKKETKQDLGELFKDIADLQVKVPGEPQFIKGLSEKKLLNFIPTIVEIVTEKPLNISLSNRVCSSLRFDNNGHLIKWINNNKQVEIIGINNWSKQMGLGIEIFYWE